MFVYIITTYLPVSSHKNTLNTDSFFLYAFEMYTNVQYGKIAII